MWGLECVLPQVLEEQLGRRGDAVAPLRPVLKRILADVQERLTFRAQAFIKVCKASFWRSCMLCWLQITVRGNSHAEKLLDRRDAWEPAERGNMCMSPRGRGESLTWKMLHRKLWLGFSPKRRIWTILGSCSVWLSSLRQLHLQLVLLRRIFS